MWREKNVWRKRTWRATMSPPPQPQQPLTALQPPSTPPPAPPPRFPPAPAPPPPSQPSSPPLCLCHDGAPYSMSPNSVARTPLGRGADGPSAVTPDTLPNSTSTASASDLSALSLPLMIADPRASEVKSAASTLRPECPVDFIDVAVAAVEVVFGGDEDFVADRCNFH